MDDVVTIVLERDRGKPAADRPTFSFRRLRRRDARRLGEALAAVERMDDSESLASFDEAMDRLVAVMGGLVVAWANQTDETGAALAFDALDLDRAMSEEDLLELATAYRVSGLVGTDEKKASGSPSPSPAVESAGSASAGDA